MNKKVYYVSNNSLYHHGIKGQKWGIRRYQNEDGSLTAEGESRYGTVENMNNTRSRNKKIAVGVGIGAAVAVGTAVAVSKNKNLKKANNALLKDNDALHDAAQILANRNKGMRGENANLKGTLNRLNNKLLESGKEIDQYERTGSILVDKLTVSNQQSRRWQELFNGSLNRAHTSALKENASRTKKSISQKKYWEGVKAKKAQGLVKKYINSGENVSVSSLGKTSTLGEAAKRTGVWVRELTTNVWNN